MNWNDFFIELVTSIKAFFNPNLSGYTNFSFGSAGIVNIHVIVWGLFIGILLASARIIYIKNCHGLLVRKLLSAEAISKDKAMTLGELGLEKYIPIRLGLKGQTLKRAVNSLEFDEYTEAVRREYKKYELEKEEKGSKCKKLILPTFNKKPNECHYYISEEKKYSAEMRYNKNGSGVGTFFFVMLIGFICVITIYALLPHLLTLVDTVLNNFTIKGKTYAP